MNVTAVPAQIVVAEAATVTEGVNDEATVMVMLLLDAVDDVTQLAEEVSVHVITIPFVNVVEVYVLLFVPTAEPFRYHW